MIKFSGLCAQAIIGFAFAIMVLAGGSAHAACAGELCTDVTVTLIYADKDGSTYVRTSGNETNLSCTADSGVFLRLDGTAPDADKVYALLLTAFTQSWAVSIRMVPSITTECQIKYVYTGDSSS